MHACVWCACVIYTICMHVCRCICMYVCCMYVCMYVCMYAYTYTSERSNATVCDICMYVCMYVYTYTSQRSSATAVTLHTCIHTTMHACMHAYTYDGSDSLLKIRFMKSLFYFRYCRLRWWLRRPLSSSPYLRNMLSPHVLTNIHATKQVHEKSILFPLLPSALLATASPQLSWQHMIFTHTALASMYPLLAR